MYITMPDFFLFFNVKRYFSIVYFWKNLILTLCKLESISGWNRIVIIVGNTSSEDFFSVR